MEYFQNITISLLTPPLSTHEVPTTSFSLESLSERTPCFRSLQDVYEIIKNQNDLTLFYLFTNYEPICFEE